MKTISIFAMVIALSVVALSKDYCYKYSSKNFKAYKEYLYDSKKNGSF